MGCSSIENGKNSIKKLRRLSQRLIKDLLRQISKYFSHHDSLFVDGAGFAVQEMGDAFLDDPAPVDFGVAVVVAHIMGEHFVVAVFIADKGYLAIGDAFRAVAV